MSIPDDICAYADRRLEGSTLTFALVLWVKGEETNPQSVALSCPPEFQKAAPTALLTTARAASGAGPGFDLVAHLYRQRAFSERTFGPGQRTAGVLDHIRRELLEIEAAPGDLGEWIDVVLLALDGAWRAGWTPEHIATALDAKQSRNEDRTWPDWRTADPDKAIEHDRTDETGAQTERCPICNVPFQPDDLCATDITEGMCHAACLEGSPVVDLGTGEPAEGPASTYRYDGGSAQERQ